MTTIVTHPDNEDLLRRTLEPDRDDGLLRISWITIRTSRFMERDKPTGRYILPDGSTVDRGDILIREPFIEYGPEDLGYLVWAGIVKEERVPLYYEINESLLRFQYDFGAMLISRGMMITATA